RCLAAVVDRSIGRTCGWSRPAGHRRGGHVQSRYLLGPELRRGFAKLLAGGLIRENSGKFPVIGEAAEVITQIRHDWQLFKQSEMLARWLDAEDDPADGPGYEDPRWPYPELTDALIEA